MLGHSSVQMTMDRYGHLYGADMDHLAEAMERTWGNSNSRFPALPLWQS